SGRLGTRVGSYVLACLYPDLNTAVLNRTRCYLPPVLDWLAYGGLLCASPLVLDDVGGISPVRHIADIPESVPILLLAAEHDDRTTLADTRSLEQQVPTHSQLVIIHGATHARLLQTQPAAYSRAVLDFLRSTTAGSI
ncbi:MAG: alpha/beta hydrolase, partial [Planctomycetota bacterium]